MITTRERLMKGANLYYLKYSGNIKAQMSNWPSVNYPNKVCKTYFDKVRNTSKNQITVYFKKRTYYKKVEGYRQVNYTKYRILSNVLCKDSDFSINIEASAFSFKNLKTNPDPEISSNALLIIAGSEIIDFFPDWAQTTFLQYIHDDEVMKITNNLKSKSARYIQDVKNIDSSKKKTIEMIELNKKLVSDSNDLLHNSFNPMINMGFKKTSMIKRLLTFGIANSKRKFNKEKKKVAALQFELDIAKDVDEEYIKKYIKEEDRYVKAKNDLANIENDSKYLLEVENEQFAYDMSNVSQPFKEKYRDKNVQKKEVEVYRPKYLFELEEPKKIIFDQSDFSSLDAFDYSSLKGMSIMGIYLIRNLITDLCQIGISFDLYRSIFDYTNKELSKDNSADVCDLEIKLIMVKSEAEMSEKFAEYFEKYDSHFIWY